MPLRDAVGENCELLKIKLEVPGIWAKGCLLSDCVGIITHDMTTPP